MAFMRAWRQMLLEALEQFGHHGIQHGACFKSCMALASLSVSQLNHTTAMPVQRDISDGEAQDFSRSQKESNPATSRKAASYRWLLMQNHASPRQTSGGKGGALVGTSYQAHALSMYQLSLRFPLPLSSGYTCRDPDKAFPVSPRVRPAVHAYSTYSVNNLS